MQYKHIVAVVSLLALAACTPTAMTPPVDGDSSSSAAAAAATVSSAPVVIKEPVTPPVAAARIIDVMVTDWSFTPATITAKKGEKVQLRLKGDKGIHGLLVADLGLNLRIGSGESTIVDLPTDVAGTFAGRCNVPCGPGHKEMTFAVVIE